MGQGPGHRRAVNFCVCAPNVDLTQLLCARKRCGIQGQSSCSESGAEAAKKLKHFACASNGRCKFACFLIFGSTKKLTIICVFLQKWRFNTLRLGMIKCPEGTKIFRGEGGIRGRVHEMWYCTNWVSDLCIYN